MLKRLIATVVFFTFTASLLMPPQSSFAMDSAIDLPAPGNMISLSPAYQPLLIKGVTVHQDNPFMFDFVMDAGDSGFKETDQQLKAEADRLIKYFFASLAIPEKDLWVNLSPYEKDRIAPEALGQTALGRDLLAQDYILKQLTASMIYPEKDLGKEFWDRIYTKARELYGVSEIPMNTFNKVWILADKATVYERGQTAFVVDGHLKVMLEEDYLALEKQQGQSGDMALAVSPSRLPSKEALDVKAMPTGMQATQRNLPAALGSQIIRELILPELEREVNHGKNFAPLRQIFNSLILAHWYKKNLKEALMNQVYSDKSTVKGVDLKDTSVKEQIYQQYLKAYKKGVFNYIKEEPQANGQIIPKKYFSGGFAVDRGMLNIVTDQTSRISQIKSSLMGQFLSPIMISAVTVFNSSQVSSLPTDVSMTVSAFRSQLELLTKSETARGFFAMSGIPLDREEIARLVTMQDTDEAVAQMAKIINTLKISRSELNQETVALKRAQHDIAVRFATVRAAYQRGIIFSFPGPKIFDFIRLLNGIGVQDNVLNDTIPDLAPRARMLLTKIEQVRAEQALSDPLNQEWKSIVQEINASIVPDDVRRLLPLRFLELYVGPIKGNIKALGVLRDNPDLLDVFLRYDATWAQRALEQAQTKLQEAIEEYGDAYVVTGQDPVGGARENLKYAQTIQKLSDRINLLVRKTTTHLLKDKKIQRTWLNWQWHQLVAKLEGMTPKQVRILLPERFLEIYFGTSREKGNAVDILQKNIDLLLFFMRYDATQAQLQSEQQVKDLANEFVGLAKKTTDLLFKDRQVLNQVWNHFLSELSATYSPEHLFKLVPKDLLNYYNDQHPMVGEDPEYRRTRVMSFIENKEGLLGSLRDYQTDWARQLLEQKQALLQNAQKRQEEGNTDPDLVTVGQAQEEVQYAQSIVKLSSEFAYLAQKTVEFADVAMTTDSTEPDIDRMMEAEDKAATVSLRPGAMAKFAAGQPFSVTVAGDRQDNQFSINPGPKSNAYHPINLHHSSRGGRTTRDNVITQNSLPFLGSALHIFRDEQGHVYFYNYGSQEIKLKPNLKPIFVQPSLEDIRNNPWGIFFDPSLEWGQQDYEEIWSLVKQENQEDAIRTWNLKVRSLTPAMKGVLGSIFATVRAADEKKIALDTDEIRKNITLFAAFLNLGILNKDTFNRYLPQVWAQAKAIFEKLNTGIEKETKDSLNADWQEAIDLLDASVDPRDIYVLLPQRLLDLFHSQTSSEKGIIDLIQENLAILEQLRGYESIVQLTYDSLTKAQDALAQARETGYPYANEQAVVEYTQRIKTLADRFAGLVRRTLLFVDSSMTAETDGSILDQLLQSRLPLKDRLGDYRNSLMNAFSKSPQGGRINALEDLSRVRKQAIDLLRQEGINRIQAQAYLENLVKGLPVSEETGAWYQLASSGELRSIGLDIEETYSNKSLGQSTEFDSKGNIVRVPTMVPPGQEAFPGGIDLTGASSGLTIQKDAKGGIKVHFDAALIAQIQRQGVQSVIPVIVNVRSMAKDEFQPILGLAF